MSPRPALTYEIKDSIGYVPDLEMLHTRWKHFKGDTYEVVDFIWDSEVDRWKCLLRNVGKTYVRCTRTPENMIEKRPDGTPRFTEVPRIED